MSNICPGCNKFAGLELEEPELEDIAVDQDSGQVNLSVRVYLTSTCCGEEMKDYWFEDNVDVDDADDLEAHIEDHKAAGEEYTLEADAELEGTERTQTEAYNRKTHKMVKITNPRYAKTYRGYSAKITVTCSCGEEFEGEFDNDEPASSFEELN